MKERISFNFDYRESKPFTNLEIERLNALQTKIDSQAFKVVLVSAVSMLVFGIYWFLATENISEETISYTAPILLMCGLFCSAIFGLGAYEILTDRSVRAEWGTHARRRLKPWKALECIRDSEFVELQKLCQKSEDISKYIKKVAKQNRNILNGELVMLKNYSQRLPVTKAKDALGFS
jgi:hypothetical protein